MRALMVPRLPGGGVCAKDDDGTLFEPIGDHEQFVTRATHLRSKIGARNIGHAAAVSLGLALSARDGISGKELWLTGLGRAKTEDEKGQVAKVAAEWADGDSIVAHYGYGIHLFCSEDRNSAHPGTPSILDPKNRQWLTEEFGIKFVTLIELADMMILLEPTRALS